jgi:XTP/dITP diphosphohydrolase
LKTLVLATGNAHKAQEFAALAGEARRGFTIVPASSLPDGYRAPEETGRTFEANAAIKALAVARVLGPDMWALADDSGLCVDALDGAPGVDTAVYAGVGQPARAHWEKLLVALAGVEPARRAAHFVCVLCVASADGVVVTVRGECPGTILAGPRGGAGFGYDPVFAPEGHTRSFAELPDDVKNALSHRGAAWRALLAWYDASVR